ncbi:MAG: heparinase II/III family protein [Pseudomonadota bacterium]
MKRGPEKPPPRATLFSLAVLAVRRVGARSLDTIAQAILQRTLAATPSRVLFAPETLLASDSKVAADIYAGVFHLAGETVETGGRSPFSVAPPSAQWARTLHGFSWLVHLEANASELSSTNARALVEEWLADKSGRSALANAPEVTAQRVTAWLIGAPILLSGADAAFNERFMRALGRQIRRLERGVSAVPPGVSKVEVAATLALAGAVIAGQGRLQRTGLSLLAEVLKTEVLPDGGHASRSPEAVVDVLCALIPVREALVRRQVPVPEALSTAIDKMMPMVRFFALSKTGLAAFHGARPVAPSRLAALMAYDDVRGQPSANARYSFFQRMDGGTARVLIDTGPPPPPSHAGRACASALAFEFTHEGEPIIVNCGALDAARPSWARAARATAAHSTLTLADRSSARILNLWPLSAALGPLLYGGPRTVDVAREPSKVRARHDGYQDQFGIIHERSITLTEDGLWLQGIDRILGADKVDAIPFAVRFHLAPGIRVRLDKARKTASLRLRSGAIWLFVVDEGPDLSVEDSVVLAADTTLRRTAQLVIPSDTLTHDTIRWHIARHAAPLGG